MTPFGEKVRRLRQERGLLLKDMAAHLGVSSAYLSALERGERGKPTWTLIQGSCIISTSSGTRPTNSPASPTCRTRA